MKKATTLFFIFLVELIFLLRPRSNPFLEDDYTYDGFLNVFSVPLIIAIILAVLFFLTLLETRKKIDEGIYSTKWLFKFCLKAFLVLFPINLIYSIIYVLAICGSPECKLFMTIGIFYSLITIPFAIFFVSFLPSIIFYKFSKNESIFKFIFRGFLIVISILLVVIIIRFTTCSLNKDTGCVAEKAIKANNYSLCDNIKREGGREGCLQQIGWRTKDIRVCDLMDYEDTYNDCLANAAANTKNADLCDQIEKEEDDSEEDFIERKNICILGVSRTSTDDNVCNKIIKVYNDNDFTGCIRNISVYTKNPSLCEKVNQYDREECYRNYERNKNK